MARNGYQMPGRIICCHCKKATRGNPRIKGKQKYCGTATCQQARKNAWEREKTNGDADYRQKRKISKKAWYEKDHCGATYQAEYRKTHPDYEADNRERQRMRNQKCRRESDASKIVKTDALGSQSADNQGIYVLLPYRKEADTIEIVKTDALLVQVVEKQVLMSTGYENSS